MRDRKKEKPKDNCSHTVDKDSKPQKGQVTLPLDGVPADVWITFSQEHRTTLETTAC